MTWSVFWKLTRQGLNLPELNPIRMTNLKSNNLAETIERLVVFGGVPVSPDIQAWLSGCGAAKSTPPASEWLVPSLPYMRDILPARDCQDLFRRTAIRDPKYRLHLDLALANVLQIIARSERWGRFEQLAFGVLKPLSQRLMSLVEWVAELSGQSANSIGDVHWQQFKSEIFREAASSFQWLDDNLWGHARDAAELFPLIEELYLPLIGHPVHLELAGLQAHVMSSLIYAARVDDGIEVSGDELVACEELRSMGAPILLRQGSRFCTLVGRVELSLLEQEHPAILPMKAAPLGITGTAKESSIHQATSEISWLQVDGDGMLIGCVPFLSVCLESGKWPESPSSDAPSWTRLPGSDAFLEAAHRNKISDHEDAVVAMDRHPLYGVLLQFLIAEALDRELGDETLLIAPPLDKVGPETEWGTSVLYRPSSKVDDDKRSESAGYLSLGSIDRVMDRVASDLSLEIIPLPYSNDHYGLWSWGLHLLIELKVVVGQRDRWALNSSLHDSLYTGKLMGYVLRDRREVRQVIHRVMRNMWDEAALSIANTSIEKEVSL